MLARFQILEQREPWLKDAYVTYACAGLVIGGNCDFLKPVGCSVHTSGQVFSQ